MKKPRKKNSIERRYQRYSRAILSNHCLAFVVSEKEIGVTLYYTKNGKKVTASPVIQAAIQTIKYKWSLYLGVFCRDQMGNQYMQGEWVQSNEPYYHTELIDTMNDLHQELISSANPNHKMNAGWIAVPVSGEIPDDMIDKIFTDLKAWDVLAPWEGK
jgi:hypothetical protein